MSDVLAYTLCAYVWYQMYALSNYGPGSASARFRPLDRFFLGLIALLAAAYLFTATPARAQVPDAAAMYRRMVDSAVIETWGEDGSSARLAAQLHQESRWKPRVASPVGAQGMAQFMPATARWIAQQFPDQLGTFDPWDAEQAILAAALYDQYLYEHVPRGASECDRWAMTLSAYNGGLGWIARDRKLAQANKADPNIWFGHVERFSARSAAARLENRDYVRRILRALEPQYIAAGWGGTAVCT